MANTIDDMYDVILHGDVDSLRTYLESLTNIDNAQLQKIQTLVFHAINKHQLECLKLLVSFKGDPTYPLGWALIYAQRVGGTRAIIDFLMTGK